MKEAEEQAKVLEQEGAKVDGTEHPIHTIAPPHPYMLALGVLSIQKVRVQWEGGKEEGERGQERDRERGDRVERRGGGKGGYKVNRFLCNHVPTGYNSFMIRFLYIHSIYRTSVPPRLWLSSRRLWKRGKKSDHSSSLTSEENVSRDEKCSLIRTISDDIMKHPIQLNL